LYNLYQGIPETVGGQSCSRKGVIIMNYVSWSELLQFAAFLTTYTALIYTVFHNKRK